VSGWLQNPVLFLIVVALHKTRLHSPPAGRRSTVTTCRENRSSRFPPTSDTDRSTGRRLPSPAEAGRLHPRTLCHVSRSGQLASQPMSSGRGDRHLQIQGLPAQRSAWRQAASGTAAGEAGAATMRTADERGRGLRRADSRQHLEASSHMNGLHS
jgi:hypothetical protein